MCRPLVCVPLRDSALPRMPSQTSQPRMPPQTDYMLRHCVDHSGILEIAEQLRRELGEAQQTGDKHRGALVHLKQQLTEVSGH